MTPKRQCTKGSDGAQRTAMRVTSMFGVSAVVAASEIVLPRYQRTANQPAKIATIAGSSANQRVAAFRRILMMAGELFRGITGVRIRNRHSTKMKLSAKDVHRFSRS